MLQMNARPLGQRTGKYAGRRNGRAAYDYEASLIGQRPQFRVVQPKVLTSVDRRSLGGSLRSSQIRSYLFPEFEYKLCADTRSRTSQDRVTVLPDCPIIQPGSLGHTYDS